MTTPNVLQGLDWARHEEEVAAKPSLVSIGIGNDLKAILGMSGSRINDLVMPLFHGLADGGANELNINGRTCYAVRRNRIVDVGTEKDFEDLGIEAIGSLFDESET